MSPRTSPWDEVPEDSSQIEDSSSRRNRWLRRFFFGVNFLLSVSICLNLIVWLAVSFDPQELVWDPKLILGVIAMLALGGPFAAYAWVEWRALDRQDQTLERYLGYLNIGLAVLGGLGVVAAIAEAFYDGHTRGLLPFLLVGLAITFYLAICGLMRTRLLAKH